MHKFQDKQAFWEFACQVYTSGNNKELCLYWQNEFGLNVNLLLLCAWLDSMGVSIKEDVFSHLENALQETNRQLHSLRTMRASLQKGSSAYQKQLEQELHIEKLQQQTLLNKLADSFISKTSLHTQNLNNTLYYLKLLDITEGSTQHSDFIKNIKKNNYFHNVDGGCEVD